MFCPDFFMRFPYLPPRIVVLISRGICDTNSGAPFKAVFWP
jgi:hypothetical protein